MDAEKKALGPFRGVDVLERSASVEKRPTHSSRLSGHPIAGLCFVKRTGTRQALVAMAITHHSPPPEPRALAIFQLHRPMFADSPGRY